LYCWYNVLWSIGGVVISNTSIANCSNTVLNVATIGNYILNLYANDSAGNINYVNSSFSVTNPTNPPPSVGGSSGGGGGGGIATSPNKTIQSGEIFLTKIEPIIGIFR